MNSTLQLPKAPKHTTSNEITWRHHSLFNTQRGNTITRFRYVCNLTLMLATILTTHTVYNNNPCIINPFCIIPFKTLNKNAHNLSQKCTKPIPLGFNLYFFTFTYQFLLFTYLNPPKVHQVHLPIIPQYNIVRLYVPMDHRRPQAPQILQHTQ